jgi:hypothetical protein
MFKKLNSLTTKMKVTYGLGIALTVIVMSTISCTKEADVTSTSSSSEKEVNARLAGPNSNAPLATAFIDMSAVGTSQTFYINCACDPTFTVTSTASLNYGTPSGNSIVVSMGSYSKTLNKNVYYYIVPVGGTFGSNTKCLKIKFKTFNSLTNYNYRASINSWSTGNVNNSNLEITIINKSAVPGCITC